MFENMAIRMRISDSLNPTSHSAGTFCRLCFPRHFLVASGSVSWHTCITCSSLMQVLEGWTKKKLPQNNPTMEKGPTAVKVLMEKGPTAVKVLKGRNPSCLYASLRYEFTGIHRKVQLKYQPYGRPHASSSEGQWRVLPLTTVPVLTSCFFFIFMFDTCHHSSIF